MLYEGTLIILLIQSMLLTVHSISFE